VATAHLVHGFLCTGKTTFARTLERQTAGVMLSADEWYLRLDVAEAPMPHLDDTDWVRMMSVLDELWPRVLERGVDVVLDFGYWRREARDRARESARAAGAGMCQPPVTATV
jgi:predicted kinase